MSLTGATAIVSLSIPLLFPTPQQLQGFAADDIFDTDAIESAEVVMGVDGIQSGGFVYVPIRQNFMMQADSPSMFVFDQWWSTQQQLSDILPANGVVILTGLSQKWTLTNGILVHYTPIPAVKKLIQPRRFTVSWQSSIPQPALV